MTIKPTRGYNLPGCHSILATTWRGLFQLCASYKRGKSKPHDADRVQLCAQALCIEEMTGLPVPEGALFYGMPRRRGTMPLDAALRERTETLVAELRDMVEKRVVPAPRHGPHCRSCSLLDICRPALSGGLSVSPVGSAIAAPVGYQ